MDFGILKEKKNISSTAEKHEFSDYVFIIKFIKNMFINKALFIFLEIML